MRKGFSLIELLIVVSIIFALVGVAVPLLEGAEREARLRAQKEIERTTEVKSFMCFSTEKGMVCRPVIEEKD